MEQRLNPAPSARVHRASAASNPAQLAGEPGLAARQSRRIVASETLEQLGGLGDVEAAEESAFDHRAPDAG